MKDSTTPSNKPRVMLCSLFVIASLAVMGRPSSDLDFTNLYGPGVKCYYGTFTNPFKNCGIKSGRHTIISWQGTDPNTDHELPFIPPGEDRVIRLGNSEVGAEAEAIAYTFTVEPDMTVLLLKFAVVLQNPNHEPNDQPRFVVKVKDSDGQLVDECANYDVNAADEIPGFHAFNIVRWRPWTNVGLDLSPYIGQKVTVQFITYDCKHNGHFGYAYFTAHLMPSHISVVDCDSVSITLTAPSDFESYLWTNGSTSPTTTISVGDGANDASCLITSVTGCQFRLYAHITVEPESAQDELFIYDTICLGSDYHDEYFDLPPQYELGDISFISTTFNTTYCQADADVILLLHVTDEVLHFNGDIEGPGDVHVSTNMHTGEYTYTIAAVSGMSDYHWTLSNPKWLIYPDRNTCRVVVTTPETAVLSVAGDYACGSDMRSLHLNATFYDTEEHSNAAVSLYPNPASGRFSVEGTHISHVTLYNLMGQTLLNLSYDDADIVSLDTETLANGIYLIAIENDSFTVNKTLVVSK